MNKYEDWISKNVISYPYGMCKEYSEKMLKEFPELKMVRGHYWYLSGHKVPHWWLKSEDGNIVDPTKNQFPCGGSGTYEEWDESQPEPTGKCMNCGEYCFNNEYACSDECKKDLECEWDDYR